MRLLIKEENSSKSLTSNLIYEFGRASINLFLTRKKLISESILLIYLYNIGDYGINDIKRRRKKDK